MSLRLTTIAAVAVSLCSADTLTLRSGRVINGQYLGGDARQIQIAVGDHVETFDVADVGNLYFSEDSADRNRGFVPPPPTPATVSSVQIPTGTSVSVRMIDKVDSNAARLGQTFRASVDESVMMNGQTVIPRGAEALVKLIEDQQSGKFAGKTILTLALTDITIDGQTIDTSTSDVSKTSRSRGARSAKVVGGATALGAIIGGLVGGGRGAAIGAASGAAVGGGAEVLTKGQQVKIPPETRLTFTLQQPIQF